MKLQYIKQVLAVFRLAKIRIYQSYSEDNSPRTNCNKERICINYSTVHQDLPDIYTHALALGSYVPSGIMYVYQVSPSLLCYNYYINNEKNIPV